MQNITLSEHLTKLALNQTDASARIEATLALVQKTAKEQGLSAEALLNLLTEKDALNVVVDKFWLEAKESMLLAKDDENTVPVISEKSVVKTKAFDECGIWGPATECKKIPDGARLAAPEGADTKSGSGQPPGQQSQPQQQQQQH